MARNLAQQALLREGGLTADDRRRAAEWRRVDDRRHIDDRRAADAQPSAVAADAPTHVRLLQDLAQAIKRNELSLDYQPVLDVQTREIVGQEALLRWNHPVQGAHTTNHHPSSPMNTHAITPAEFIPLAEGSGEITAIGRWALNHALRRGGDLGAAVWRVAGQSVAGTVPPGRSGGNGAGRPGPPPTCRVTDWNWSSPRAC